MNKNGGNKALKIQISKGNTLISTSTRKIIGGFLNV